MLDDMLEKRDHHATSRLCSIARSTCRRRTLRCWSRPARTDYWHCCASCSLRPNAQVRQPS